ncbi:ABC transporter ATP-binding protein [Kaistia dalseonensis]|uniref:Osmoprotectant transport system ATP-binding protein n=1 Tax=Kaistia dalseonensis TaxID=410840 RepID=A0ABU0H7B4_9HYPH|nr:ABC transporter ATP-binding protein [Kaistia dalseonensis]MCX5495336.1 ABC transporter ATP-binding protein [Kaistia dalseonensis]MDQ0437922.1 osmoprotectant transport system ATP-binding protein [Kaistia dalseonensis]
MIDFEHVGKTYGGWQAIEDLSLSIAEGEFCVLIGPSGSGKTTTLKMINRLIEHDSGRILFAGAEIRSFKPEELRRRMGYAIQSIGLFPHWTVEENIGTVPSLLKWPKAKIRDRVTELLELLNLDPAQYRDRYPHHLSGGQQQRIGVARALAADPDVLLMDEPFGALDPVTRDTLQLEMLRIHKASGKTIVLVTHDIDEAIRLGSRIVILDGGRIVQSGSPRDILARPANDFVSDFVGREDIGIKLLSIETVSSRVRRDGSASGEPIAATATLRNALSTLVARGVDSLPVADSDGSPLGAIHLADLVGPHP